MWNRVLRLLISCMPWKYFQDAQEITESLFSVLENSRKFLRILREPPGKNWEDSDGVKKKSRLHPLRHRAVDVVADVADFVLPSGGGPPFESNEELMSLWPQ